MKIAYLLPAICLATLSIFANADTLTLVSSNGQIGPYSMQLNGNPVNLFCMDDFRTVSYGESWQVTVVNGSNYLTSNTHSSNFKYEEEAYILSQLGAFNQYGHIYTNTDIQDALWNIFDSDSDTTSYTNALVNGAHGASYTDAFLKGFNFYIPVDPDGRDPKNWDGNGIPQEFIGTSTSPTPEPSTLVLFGSGLLGLAGAVRRKLVRS